MLEAVIRVDASRSIGAGHLMRCLALADALSARGIKCEFVSSAHLDGFTERVASAGHALHAIGGNADGTAALDWSEDVARTSAVIGSRRRDLLIVDHYGLDARWESAMRGSVPMLMGIDDLADRPHDLDLLLDQNLGRRESDYRHLLSAGARCMFGPEHALLRGEFADRRAYSLSRRGMAPPRRVLVSLGGGDHGDLSGRVLGALEDVLSRESEVTVVSGRGAPAVDSVRARAENLPFACKFLPNIGDMARVLADSDIAIGAGGVSSWERCALGVPSIIVVVAENQRDNAMALEACGAAVAISDPGAIAAELPTAFRQLAATDKLRAASRAAASLVDGLGADRVAIRLVEMLEAGR